MRVLIIEPDAKTHRRLKKSLEEEFFAVDLSLDGKQGSYLARTNDYDVVLVANKLTGLSGADVCREIRKAGKSVPILGLASNQDVELRIELFDAGADDCMSKPYFFRELLVRLYALVRRSPVIDPGHLTVGEVTLDKRAQKARCGNREISLSRKEFSILEILFKNKGTVVSRHALFEYVWDLDADPFSTALEAHIFNVRRKLGRVRGKKLIRNVPGRGYLVE